jgi:hypothetical protein
VYVLPADAELQPLRLTVVLPETPADAPPAAVDLGENTLAPANSQALEVLLADGTPASDAELLIHGEGGVAGVQVGLDDDGKLQMIGRELKAGDTVFVTGVEQHLSWRHELQGAAPWRLRWPDGGLEVRVTDEGGTDLAEFAVLVDGERFDGEQGKCSILGVSAGEHDVLVVARDRMAQRQVVRLAGGQRLERRVVLRRRP